MVPYGVTVLQHGITVLQYYSPLQCGIVPYSVTVLQYYSDIVPYSVV